MRHSRLAKIMMLMGGVTPTVILTCTTTGAGQTLTLQRLGAVTGKTIHVDWGDGTSNDYTDNPAATRTHVYATAAAYTVTISPPDAVVNLDLRDTKLSCAAGNIGKLTNLTSLFLYNLANVKVGAGEIGKLTNLTFLFLYNVANVTVGAGEVGNLINLTSLLLENLANVTVGAGEIDNLTSLTTLKLKDVANVTVGAGEIGRLTNLTNLTLNSVANVTVGAGEIGGLTNLVNLYLINSSNIAAQTGLANLLKLTTLQYENSLSQAQVDSVLAQLYAAFPSRTGTGGTIDLLGGGNAAPSGTSPGSAECPPTTGWNTAYQLVNDTCGISTKHWTSVTCQT